MSVQEYKCPCCGGSLVFDSKSQKLRCPSCNNKYNMDTFREYADIVESAGEKKDTYDWGDESHAALRRETGDGHVIYTCPSCGGEIEADNTTAATKCPYCDSPAILSGKVSGKSKPDIIIPFKIDKEQAANAYKEFCKGKKLLPGPFRSAHRTDDLKGIYVPFWFFSCQAEGAFNYDAQRTKIWKDAEYEYTQTQYYLLSRKGEASFEYVPVDGSISMDDAYMESLEPYDMTAAVPFEEGYLSGFSAEKYDVTKEECRPRAEERIHKSFEEMISKSIDRKVYHNIIPNSTHLDCTHGNIKYGLLPVWTLQVKYNDRQYYFAMNGQTGKVTGELPVDNSQFFTTAVRFFALSSIITYIILLLFSFI